MKIFLPPLKTHHTMKIMAGSLVILLLSSCSSPIKYTPRTPFPVSSGQTQSLGASPVMLAETQKADAHSVSSTLSNDSVTFDSCGSVYRVKSGDTLSEIARSCNISMRQIATFNQLSYPYIIYKNQRLQIPQKEVRPYDLVEVVPEASGQFKQKNSTSKLQKKQLKAEILPEVLTKQVVKQSHWQWPVNSNVPYRFIRDEGGLSVVEIYGVAGQTIHAVASGSVVYSGEGIVNFGKMLVIKHDDDYMSVYAHNSALLVQEGERITAGQHIADLGATGNTVTSKLYLEARFQGRKIDIQKILSSPR